MSFKGRVIRLAFAVGVAGLLSAQIPMSGGVALADDEYNLGGGSGARLPIEIGVIALVGYGVYSTFSNGGTPGATPTVSPGETGDGGAGAIPAPADAPIWDVASGNADLSDFANAADKADMKGTLRDSGTYTVFSPTHEAFAALPTGTLAALEQPANQAAFKALIQSHVVPGNRYTIAQLKQLPGVTADPGAGLTTLSGSTLYVKYTPGAAATDAGALAVSNTPFADGTSGVAVTQTDINARNGVIHPIGAVLQTAAAPAGQ